MLQHASDAIAHCKIDRRAMMKLTGAGGVAIGVASHINNFIAEGQVMFNEWDKVFPRSASVDYQKVAFKNRYGISLAADLYLPRSRGNKRLAAIAVAVRWAPLRSVVGPLRTDKKRTRLRHGGV